MKNRLTGRPASDSAGDLARFRRKRKGRLPRLYRFCTTRRLRRIREKLRKNDITPEQAKKPLTSLQTVAIFRYIVCSSIRNSGRRAPIDQLHIELSRVALVQIHLEKANWSKGRGAKARVLVCTDLYNRIAGGRKTVVNKEVCSDKTAALPGMTLSDGAVFFISQEINRQKIRSLCIDISQKRF